MKNESNFAPEKSLKSQVKDNENKGHSKVNGQLLSSKSLTIAEKAKSAQIDLSAGPTQPPVVLKIDNQPAFFLGDFSLIIGKAKSRKTFLNSLLSSILAGNKSDGLFHAELPENKRKIIFIDTEQGVYNAHKTAKRVCRLVGHDVSQNFSAYSLRKYSPKERIMIIEYLVYNIPDIGVVFIDGVRDLVTSINDEEQSTKLSSKLLKWTEELNIHVCCVLHMNKADKNPRGHLGTELLNKSQITISVEKFGKGNNFSKVSVVESREKEFEPFSFGIDENDLPYITDTKLIGSSTKPMLENSEQEANEKLKQIFSSNQEFSYTQLKNEIKEKFQVGENKAKDYIKLFVEKTWLKKRKDGTKTMYSLV